MSRRYIHSHPSPDGIPSPLPVEGAAARWFPVPTALLPWLPHLSHQQLKVVLCLLQHQNMSEGVACPGAGRIARQTLDLDSNAAVPAWAVTNVRRIIKELTKKGFVHTVEAGKGGRKSAVRRVVIPPPPVAPNATGAHNATAPVAPNATAPVAPNATLIRSSELDTLITQHQQQPAAAPDADAGFSLNEDGGKDTLLASLGFDDPAGNEIQLAEITRPDDDVPDEDGWRERKRRDAFEELKGHRVGEPTRSRLLDQFPDLSANIIADLASEMSDNAGPGVLIRSIEAEAAELIEAELASEARNREAAADRTRQQSEAAKQFAEIAREMIIRYENDPKYHTLRSDDEWMLNAAIEKAQTRYRTLMGELASSGPGIDTTTDRRVMLALARVQRDIDESEKESAKRRKPKGIIYEGLTL